MELSKTEYAVNLIIESLQKQPYISHCFVARTSSRAEQVFELVCKKVGNHLESVSRSFNDWRLQAYSSIFYARCYSLSSEPEKPLANQLFLDKRIYDKMEREISLPQSPVKLPTVRNLLNDHIYE